MPYWNYRIMKTELADGADTVVYNIHEVHYDDDGTVLTWTMDPVVPLYAESPEEALKTLRLMLEDAQRQPILDTNGKEIEVIEKGYFV